MAPLAAERNRCLSGKPQTTSLTVNTKETVANIKASLCYDCTAYAKNELTAKQERGKL